MRVLTVRQPWAWAIIHGGKDVENRVRSLGPYRGLVAVHASGRWAPEAFDDPILGPIMRTHWGMTRHNYVGADLPTRAVIGVADLTDVHDDGACFERSLAAEYQRDPGAVRALPDNGAGGLIGRARMCSEWAMPDHHHLELANPRPLARPIPAKGRLGLWRPDAALEAAIREQIGEA